MKKVIGLLFTSFALVTLASCNNKTNTNDDYELSIVCPSGAPIVGIASAVNNYEGKLNKENIGVDASTLQGFFTATENKSDIIIAPINSGTKLYNLGKSTYKIAAVLTWGNTYFASQTEFNITDIKNNGVTLFGKSTINSAVAEYILSEMDSNPETYNYLADAAATKNELIDNSSSIVMTAEPMLSIAKTNLTAQGKSVTSYSIADLYKQVTQLDMPQAAVFINPDTIASHKNVLDSFLAKIDETDELCQTSPESVADDAISLGLSAPKAVLAKAIPNCKVSYQKASDKKEEIDKLIEVARTYFEKKPDTSFYY